MKIVPLVAVASQTLTVQLGGQPCRINVYQKSTGLYVDLYVSDQLIIGGVLALDRNRIVRSAYLGFLGDLEFADTQGREDPVSTGLGSRFLFCYIEAV